MCALDPHAVDGKGQIGLIMVHVKRAEQHTYLNTLNSANIDYVEQMRPYTLKKSLLKSLQVNIDQFLKQIRCWVDVAGAHGKKQH